MTKKVKCYVCGKKMEVDEKSVGGVCWECCDQNEHVAFFQGGKPDAQNTGGVIQDLTGPVVYTAKKDSPEVRKTGKKSAHN